MTDFVVTLTDGTVIASTPVGDDGHSTGPFHIETDETGIGLYWAMGWDTRDTGHVNTRSRFLNWAKVLYLDRPNGPLIRIEQ